MISKYSHKGLTWFDLESPSKEELSHIIDLHSIPPYIHEKINTDKQEDKIDINDDYTFIILNIPTVIDKIVKNNRMIFVYNNNFVLTIHDHPIQAFSKFGKEMELDISSTDSSKITNNNLLFAHLLKNLYLHSETQLVEKIKKVDYFKQQIFKNRRKIKWFATLAIILLITTIIFICL